MNSSGQQTVRIAEAVGNGNRQSTVTTRNRSFEFFALCIPLVSLRVIASKVRGFRVFAFSSAEAM
jgi:hypothetical protein